MTMKLFSPRRCAGFTAALLLLPALLSGAAQASAAETAAPKPLGAFFSNYAKLIVDDEYVWPGAFIDTHYTSFDIRNLPKYSALLFGSRGSSRQLTPEEITTLGKWVEGGGVLILTVGEPTRLFGKETPKWFAGGGRYFWTSQPYTAKFQDTNHPLTRGLQGLSDLMPGEKPEENAPIDGWVQETGLTEFTSGHSLIGKDNYSMLYVNEHGKGKIIYAGGNLIPNQNPRAVAGTVTLNLAPLQKQFLDNLMKYLGLPARSETIAAWAKGRQSKAPLSLWYRHDADEKPLGAKAQTPAYPVGNEELKELRYDMGIGERNRRYFFVTATREIPALQINATDLKSTTGTRIPSQNIHIFIQEKPRPDYPKGSYYLVDTKWVEPIGSSAVKLQADEAYTYWVFLDTGEAAPGNYSGALRFQSGNTLLQSLPLNVKVWPLHQPRAEVLHFELEHDWTSLPGAWWLDPKTYNADLLKKYIDDLGGMGVDIGMTWGDNGYYCNNSSNVRLREDGTPLNEAITKDPERFKKDPLPALSFTGGPWDVWWNNAIGAGMLGFSQSYGPPGVALGLAFQIYKNDKLTVQSPEYSRLTKWYEGEYHKYLRERGLRDTYIKYGDEFGPEGVPAYNEVAESLRAAGFKLYTTAYNLIPDKEAVLKVDPQMDMWQVSWPREDLHQFFKKNHIPFDADNEVWGVGTSSWWGASLDYGLGYGMTAARARMNGIHVHGYMRWLHNEAEGAYVGPDGPFPAASNTMWAQSITEGRYLAQLYRLIDLAKKTGRGRNAAVQIEKDIESEVIGVPVPGKPLPLIPLALEDTTVAGIKTHNAFRYEVSPESTTAAKVKVFQMLLRLQKAMGDLKPDVLYDKIPLVKNGRPVCHIVYGDNAQASGKLVARIAQLGGIRPTASAQMDATANPQTLVLVGTLKNNAALAKIVSKELQSEITPFYPQPGTYAIRRLAATSTRPEMLLVVGGDAAGVEIGTRNLGQLLTIENRF